jgi:hypothetical protein
MRLLLTPASRALSTARPSAPEANASTALSSAALNVATDVGGAPPCILASSSAPTSYELSRRMAREAEGARGRGRTPPSLFVPLSLGARRASPLSRSCPGTRTTILDKFCHT